MLSDRVEYQETWFSWGRKGKGNDRERRGKKGGKNDLPKAKDFLEVAKR